MTGDQWETVSPVREPLVIRRNDVLKSVWKEWERQKTQSMPLCVCTHVCSCVLVCAYDFEIN